MRIIVAVIFILCVPSILFAVDESLYVKDTVPVDNNYACQVGQAAACEAPILLNKTTKQVEYYWSAADNKWIGAGTQQQALQALYDKRKYVRTQRQLKQMQDEMDKRLRESMEEGQRNTPTHK